jgi:hypothetical protein
MTTEGILGTVFSSVLFIGGIKLSSALCAGERLQEH